MSRDVDNTQERPLVARTRVRGEGGRATSPASARAGRDGGRSAGAREAGRSRGTRAEAYRDDRYARPRETRGSGGPSQRGAARGTSRPRSRNERRRGGLRVPLVLVIILLILAVVCSVFVTRCAMNARVEAAETAAVEAEAEAMGYKRQLAQTVTSPTPVEETTTQSAGKDDATSASTPASTGEDDPWLEAGTFTTGDATLDGEVKAFCDAIADPSMGLDTAALEVYKGIAWSEYVERDDAQHPAGKDWRIEYARKYYEHDCSGNCYEFSAFLMYCMRYLGFEDAKAEGVILELQSGNWGEHGLVYLTNTDGRSCLLDTSLGTDGWMLDSDAYNVQIQDFENA